MTHSVFDAQPRVATSIPERIAWGMIGILGLAMIVLMASCSSPEPVRTPMPVKVKVPVSAPAPTPTMPTRPALPVREVDSTSSPAAVTRAYVSSVILLQGYARQLETLLRSYRDSTRAGHVGGRE